MPGDEDITIDFDYAVRTVIATKREEGGVLFLRLTLDLFPELPLATKMRIAERARQLTRETNR